MKTLRNIKRGNANLCTELDWKSISLEKASRLERPFEEEELKREIWNMGTEKAPGPDGFFEGFFQACWDIVKVDLLKVLDEFHRIGKIGVSINSMFISLVPKKDRSVRVKDYRPISLVTSLYKIIAKILSSRLNEVISDTILENQSAYCR